MLKRYLTEQLRLHPNMQPQDVVKLCYQAAFGAEHLLEQIEAAKTYFAKEYAEVIPTDQPLYEQISDEIVRMNLGAWKAAELPQEWLFRMFTGTVFREGRQADMLRNLAAAEEVLQQCTAAFSMEEWQRYITAYKEKGMAAVHHSTLYRETEHPAYRIVSTKYLRILPVLLRLAERKDRDNPYLIALDGRAGAGKSTAAELLCQVLDTDAVYMDDFFLPSALRSQARLEQPGGNVHYERFIQQVLPHLHSAEAFSYDIFDCSSMDYYGVRRVRASKWRVVEGSYSHHPQFGNYADLKVFVDVEADEQLRRIKLRNGAEMAEMFRTRWIPMEEAYFKAFGIRDAADFVI